MHKIHPIHPTAYRCLSPLPSPLSPLHSPLSPLSSFNYQWYLTYTTLPSPVYAPLPYAYTQFAEDGPIQYWRQYMKRQQRARYMIFQNARDTQGRRQPGEYGRMGRYEYMNI